MRRPRPAAGQKDKSMAQTQVLPTACHSEGLADILERVLDKGVVIAGDIKIKLCDIELLTIQIRLLVCSVDKAREMGLTWWWEPPQQQQPPHHGRGHQEALPCDPPAPIPSEHYEQLQRRAEEVVHIISHQPRKQKGPSDGQTAKGPNQAPTAR